MIRPDRVALGWQSKAVLLLVLPLVAPAVLLESNWWAAQIPVVAWTTLGISAVFGLVVWRLRAGTARAAVTGAAITACLMFGTTNFPYQYSWLHGALLPLLTVFLLTFAATKAGRAKKESLGLGEDRHGRNSAQVAANLGVSALVVIVAPLSGLLLHVGRSPLLTYAAMLAALAEAAADTASSEVGQAFGGQPRMFTTLRPVPRGTNGAVTLTGTAAGVIAAVVVAVVGAVAMPGGMQGLRESKLLIALAAPGAIFGLLFDSVLGATLERKGLLNNDAVNFISTLSAALFCVAEGILISRYWHT